MSEDKAKKLADLNVEVGRIESVLSLMDRSHMLLNESPCTRAERCLEIRSGEAGWGGMDPNRMCPSCAAYWYVGQAANLLRIHKTTCSLSSMELELELVDD